MDGSPSLFQSKIINAKDHNCSYGFHCICIANHNQCASIRKNCNRIIFIRIFFDIQIILFILAVPSIAIRRLLYISFDIF